jgi:hypothetical protein
MTTQFLVSIAPFALSAAILLAAVVLRRWMLGRRRRAGEQKGFDILPPT